MKTITKLSMCFIAMFLAFSLVSCSVSNADTSALGNTTSSDSITTPSDSTTTSNETITLAIQEITYNYFNAGHPWPSPETFKVVASLDEDYCVGDYVDVTYDDQKKVDKYSYEITALSVSHSDYKLDPNVDYKPVIYLYPTEKTEISATLNYNGTLTHTYPLYTNGWKVTAYPDGTLVDAEGTIYPYLFWEGESDVAYDMSRGYCVRGEDTALFLRDRLTYMGLNENERQEFIDFWLPFMEENSYNLIAFQTSVYTENAELIITPQPDSMLRVFYGVQVVIGAYRNRCSTSAIL